MNNKPIEVQELDDRWIRLVIKGYPVALVNAIRRSILSDVPTMAVDFAYFYENSSSVYDEIIAHRLGLVVLKSDEALGKYKSPEECREASETDSKCFVELIIEKEVPEDSDRGVYVRASDIKSSDPDVVPVYPETPLTYLAPGQRLHIVAYARLGRGREHGKWSPASIAALRYTPRIIFDSSRFSEGCWKCLEAYGELVEKIKSIGKGELELSNLTNTSGLRYCAEKPCYEALEVQYDRNKLILEVESTGSLRPERIVAEALKALRERVKAVISAFEALG